MLIVDETVREIPGRSRFQFTRTVSRSRMRCIRVRPAGTAEARSPFCNANAMNTLVLRELSLANFTIQNSEIEV